MKIIQSLAVLASATTLFAQTPATQTPAIAPNAIPAVAATQVQPVSCSASFDVVKNLYPRDAFADNLYAEVNARISSLKKIEDDGHKTATYNTEMKNCDLAVELLKLQLSNVVLRKSLDSLFQKELSAQKEISAIKDSLIELWSSDAKGAKSLNAALSEERNRLERSAEQDSIEKARLAKELEDKQKALAEKDSLLAAQKAEAEKKLDALRSKTISVYKDARGTILSMSDILFATGKADLMQELKVNLAEIAAILKSLLTDSHVVVEGHTDNVGKPETNQKLSEQRASAVLNYLVERGVERNRLQSVGYGQTKPVADNNTTEGKAKNRRVELVIKDN